MLESDRENDSGGLSQSRRKLPVTTTKQTIKKNCFIIDSVPKGRLTCFERSK